MNEQTLIWLLSIIGIVVGSAGIGYVTGFRHGWQSGFDSCSEIWAKANSFEDTCDRVEAMIKDQPSTDPEAAL